MKILHLIPQLNFGGTESVVLSFNQKLIELGHESSIVVFTDQNPRDPGNNNLINCGHQDNVQINLLKGNIKHIEYEKLIDKFKPDIVHSHSYSSHIIALAGKRDDIKYLLHFHRFPEKRHFDLTLIKEYITLYFSIKKFGKTSIVYVSESLKRALIRNYPFLRMAKGLLCKIPNPIDPIATVNDDYNPSDSYTLTTITRLQSEKNIELIPEIAKLLDGEGLKFVWNIYGNGNKKAELKEWIQMNNLDSKVHLMNTTNDIKETFKKSDLFVSLSIKETFGLSILEAMACGLPVFALKNTGSDDFLKNEINSIYINNQGTEFIANSIVLLLRNSDLRTTLAKNAGITAGSYDINVVIRELLKIYKN